MRTRKTAILAAIMILTFVLAVTPLMAADRTVEFHVPGCDT
jgi:hypothetical protein